VHSRCVHSRCVHSRCVHSRCVHSRCVYARCVHARTRGVCTRGVCTRGVCTRGVCTRGVCTRGLCSCLCSCFLKSAFRFHLKSALRFHLKSALRFHLKSALRFHLKSALRFHLKSAFRFHLKSKSKSTCTSNMQNASGKSKNGGFRCLPSRSRCPCHVRVLLQLFAGLRRVLCFFQSFVVNAGRGSVGEESTQPVTYSVHGQTWLRHALCISAGNLITEPSK
jgi:hypothetical protein